MAETIRPQPTNTPEKGGYEPPVFFPRTETQLQPDIAVKKDYEYPLQQRIATEYRHLFGKEFTPALNLEIFRQKKEEVFELSTIPKITDEVTLMRKMAELKIAAVSLATSYNLDIKEIVDRKLYEVMQDKYPPDAFTELRFLGHSVDEARAILKGLYERKEKYQMLGIVIPEYEEEARMPREEAFPDEIQAGVDWWERASLGSDRYLQDRTPIVLGEADELIEEFGDLDNNQINSITDTKKLRDKIGEEIADVVIAIDGYFSTKDKCVGSWHNFALDRMIDTYGDLPKLRRRGLAVKVAMDYLKECRNRDDDGNSRPHSILAGYAGPIFRITAKAPLEPNFSSEMIH